MINHDKVYHTPLLNTLRKAFHLILQSQKNGQTSQELLDILHYRSSERRRFIGNAVKAGVAVSAAGILNGCKKVTDLVPPAPTGKNLAARKKNQPEIVIIGGGMAGLNCAYKLQNSGYTATIYEGSSRTSGRIFSKQNLLAQGLYTELGGEFIDTGHKDMLALCSEFNLGLLDTGTVEESAYVRDSFYINGKFHSEAQVIEAFHPYASRIKEDINSLPAVMTYDDHDATTVHFDNTSIAEYLDSIGMNGFLRKGIETAYLTEYGLETTIQSSINFLFLFSPKTADGFHIFGSSDERYKIEGGNQSLTQAIYKEVKNSVVLGHKLIKIEGRNSGYKLYFTNANGNTVEVNADIVVCAIPFTLLREVELDVELPDWKTNAIKNLGYGTNAKLLLGFNTRVWRQYQHSGYVFTDKALQTGWDNSWAQPGTNGGYTVYQGGNDGLALGFGSPGSQATEFINQLEKMWPGCRHAYNGNVKRMHWPTSPFTKGSYASYKLGQYTTIRGAEIKPIGNLYFAGEHCSANFQGFMNGAAATGRIAARSVIQSIKAVPLVSNG
ncbi:MAG: FAD-dependent oxidoreductase [Ginsengibacter sp.]